MLLGSCGNSALDNSRCPGVVVGRRPATAEDSAECRFLHVSPTCRRPERHGASCRNAHARARERRCDWVGKQPGCGNASAHFLTVRSHHPPPTTLAHTRCIGSAASRERLVQPRCVSPALMQLITSTHMSWIKQTRGGPSTANTGPRHRSSAAHASIGDQHHHALRYAAQPAKDPEDWRFWNGAGTAIAHNTESQVHWYWAGRC